MLVELDDHSLSDELLILKAKTQRELTDFEGALASLDKINQTYYYEILGDDAFFLTAQILDYDLNRSEDAMQLYEQLLTKFR